MIAEVSQLQVLWVNTVDFLNRFHQTVQATLTQPELPVLLAADSPRQ